MWFSGLNSSMASHCTKRTRSSPASSWATFHPRPTVSQPPSLLLSPPNTPMPLHLLFLLLARSFCWIPTRLTPSDPWSLRLRSPPQIKLLWAPYESRTLYTTTRYSVTAACMCHPQPWPQLASALFICLLSTFPLSPFPCCDCYLLFVDRDERVHFANFWTLSKFMALRFWTIPEPFCIWVPILLALRSFLWWTEKRF